MSIGDVVTCFAKAKIGGLLPPRWRRVERLKTEKAELLEDVDGASEAGVAESYEIQRKKSALFPELQGNKERVRLTASKNGRQVFGQSVLLEVAQRIAVGNSFKGETVDNGNLGEILAQQLRAGDRNLARVEAEAGVVEGGGEDASRGPSVPELT